MLPYGDEMQLKLHNLEELVRKEASTEAYLAQKSFKKKNMQITAPDQARFRLFFPLFQNCPWVTK
jgi:hypothetical protein